MPPHEPNDHQFVQVSVDGHQKTVKKGKYIVSEFKAIVDVPANYELDQVVAGQFDPLADDATIHIKGDEVFVSHVRRGGSS
jgi:hypothetical protein